jgi:hypothetical protein
MAPVMLPSWFPFLRLEAELAITFIDTARLHSNPANSARCLGNARKALAQIKRSLIKPAAYGLGEDEVSFLQQRCVEIEVALSL